VSKGVAPSLIARAHLFNEIMLNRDLSAKGRFDSIYGTGAADCVLSGR
jgi:hypothetical protein